MSNPDPGALVIAVPQTFHKGNWPFLVFLLVLGTALAVPAWLMGNTLAAVLLFSIGLGVAFLAFLVQRLSERARPSLVAVHEQGLVIRQKSEQFVPWRELERLETFTVRDEDGFRPGTDVFLTATLLDGRTVVCGTNPALHDAVRARAGLSVVHLGQKSGW